jgi:hypothetical protein
MLCFQQIWARLWVLAATSLTIAPRSTLPQKAARHEMQISHKTKCSQATRADSIATVTTFARTWTGTGFESSPSMYAHSRSHVPATHTRNTEKACAGNVLPADTAVVTHNCEGTKPPATFATVASRHGQRSRHPSPKRCDSLSDMLALAVNPKSFRCKNDFTSPRLGRIRCQYRFPAHALAIPVAGSACRHNGDHRLFSALYLRNPFP